MIETTIITALITALVGLIGVLAGMLYKSSVIDRMRDDYNHHIQTLWQSVARLGDECDTLRARIYDLERKLEEGKDDGK